jgi:uncharacterized membrane protein
MNFQKLKTNEKIVTVVAISLSIIFGLAQIVTSYLLDPDTLVLLIFSSLFVIFIFYIAQHFSKQRKASSLIIEKGFLQKFYSVITFFLVCAVFASGFIELYSKISRLKTESPFFMPTQEAVISNYNTKVANFDKTIELIKKSNGDQIIINMRNQELHNKYYSEIVQNLKSLEILFATKHLNQISLSVFKSKKKDIMFLFAAKLVNEVQRNNCKKIKTDFYLCTFDATY